MRLLTLEACLALAFLWHGAGSVYAQSGEIEFEKVKWAPLSPKDTMVGVAMLRVDSVSRATQMLYRLPPNTTSPCHWHTASQGTMVLRGSLSVRRIGAANGPRLGVGGYAFFSGGTPFEIVAGPTVTIVV